MHISFLLFDSQGNGCMIPAEHAGKWKNATEAEAFYEIQYRKRFYTRRTLKKTKQKSRL